MNEPKSSSVTRSHLLASKLLQMSFVLLLSAAGGDKFFNMLVFWPQYIPTFVDKLVPLSPQQIMYGAGVLELLCACLVYFKPKIGGIATGILLASIIANLALIPGYFNIILLDLVLLIQAFALAILSSGT